MTTRPNVNRVWASEAAPSNVQDPDKLVPNKVATGWEAEIPPFQWFNWVQQNNDLFKLSLAERGVTSWGTDVSYTKGALAFLDEDGRIYVAEAANKNSKPSDESVVWSLSAIQITQKNIDDLESRISSHIDSRVNPHSVTAAQVGAYTKAQVDAKLATTTGDIDTHKADRANPHRVTAAQAGGILKTGGTYSGQINSKAEQFVLAKGKTTSVCGLEAKSSGMALMQGVNRLGIDNSNVPYFQDAAKKNNLLYDASFPALKLKEEPKYAVPRPDFWMPLSGDINIYEGVGTSEFSRASTSQYINKQGVPSIAAIDEPVFEKEGYRSWGQVTRQANEKSVPTTQLPDVLSVDSSVLPLGDLTISLEVYKDTSGVNKMPLACGNDATGLFINFTHESQVAVRFGSQYFVANARHTLGKNKVTLRSRGNTLTIFVNGVSNSAAKTTEISKDSKMFLGSFNSNLYHLDGHIKSLRIWNQALTDEQISTL